MTVIVDTPIWSLALRRRTADLSPRDRALVSELEALVEEGRVCLVGSVRQEVLSGIRDDLQFERIANELRAFRDEPLKTGDYETAAGFSNQCRRNGLAGGSVDFQICAIATRLKSTIFTTDRDFEGFAAVIPVSLHTPRFASAGSK